MMIQKNKQQEQGRSMVEMLGVLAVVGVLSVGGIAGYTYAMNKHYANELLMGASERAVLVSAQILVGKTPSLSEFNNTTAGGTFGTVEEFDEGGFGLRVSDVKDVVCQDVIKATADTSIFIAKDDNAEVLNEMSESDCSGDNNAFWFVYDDLGGNGANSGDSSGEGGTEPLNCVNGIWDDKYNKCACATGWTGELCDKKDCSIYTDAQTCFNNGCIPIYFKQQDYFGCYNSDEEVLAEANKNSCLIGGIGPYYSYAFNCNTELEFVSGNPCFYPDKYTCNAGMVRQCKNGTWNNIEGCLSGCKGILGSSVDEICDELD